MNCISHNSLCAYYFHLSIVISFMFSFISPVCSVILCAVLLHFGKLSLVPCHVLQPYHVCMCLFIIFITLRFWPYACLWITLNKSCIWIITILPSCTNTLSPSDMSFSCKNSLDVFISPNLLNFYYHTILNIFVQSQSDFV